MRRTLLMALVWCFAVAIEIRRRVWVKIPGLPRHTCCRAAVARPTESESNSAPPGADAALRLRRHRRKTAPTRVARHRGGAPTGCCARIHHHPRQPRPRRHTDQIHFKGATFSQVIDFFSRRPGLPVGVGKTPAPDARSITSPPQGYDLPERCTC